MRTDRFDATIFGTGSLLALALGGASEKTLEANLPQPSGPPTGFAGIWRNADGSVRLYLDKDWSYEGHVEGRDRSARGTYHPDGGGLLLQDESGLRTQITVGTDGLEMAGHRLYKAA
jgi:hypothetical protein